MKKEEIERRMKEAKEGQKRYHLIYEVFRPSTPVDAFDCLIGRRGILMAVFRAVTNRGAHLVLFGERGVGKTSIANVLWEIHSGGIEKGKEDLEDWEIDIGEVDFCIKVNADSSDDYSSLWIKILGEVKLKVDLPLIGFTRERREETISLLDTVMKPDKAISPGDVLMVLSNFRKCLIIIDEFDRVRDRKVRRYISDTIKGLSDSGSLHTMLLVGVGQNVADLIGEHPSIERCLRQIPVTRMNDLDLEEVIDRGLEKLELTIEPAVKTQIANLSNGFPHYTHLLALWSTLSAFEDRGVEHIDQGDFEKALTTALRDAQESITALYKKAVGTKKEDNLFQEVALASALAPEDEEHSFRAGDLKKTLGKIYRHSLNARNFSHYLSKLTSQERGPLLERVGKGKPHRYRFTNPMMKPFILIKGYNEGLIGKDFYLFRHEDQSDMEDFLSPERAPVETYIDIKEGEQGFSYERLFFPYIKDAKTIRLTEPYIRYEFQIRNLINFCEIVPRHRDWVKLFLDTKWEEGEEHDLRDKFEQLKKNLADEKIEFAYRHKPGVHDRRIQTDTGWSFLLTRGLDIFLRKKKYSLGESDQTRRKCKECSIIYRFEGRRDFS